MGGLEWGVIAAGFAAIVWVNWYFLVAARTGTPAAAVAPSGTSGVQTIDIVVQGGYTPASIRVTAGKAVQLVFDRRETSGCSEEVVFPDFGLRTFLPAHQKTAVTILPPKPGVYEFACGMSMLHGRVIAE